jgi:dipeptidyl-peptidase-4
MRAASARRFVAILAVALLPSFTALPGAAGQGVGTYRATPPQKPAVAARAPLTIDWIFGPEGRSVARLPQSVWLNGGTLLMLDTRRPEGERTFELLDPATGTRRPALDMARAMSGLKALSVETAPGATLSWPIAFDGSGRRALYGFKGDLFLLDLPGARFTRVTTTDAEEKCATFSPDGRKIGFVRAHDLFVYDIDGGREVRLTRDGAETLLNGTLSWVYWEEVFGRRDIGYWWAPDSTAIAYLQTDESPVEVSYFVDFKPVIPNVIRQRYPKAGFPNPQVRVGIVEAGGGETRWIRIEDRPFEYIVRVKWLPEGRRVSVQTMTRDHGTLNFYVVDRATAVASHVLAETDPAWVNINDDLYFLKGGEFLWGSERDGFLHLYRYSPDGRLLNQVTKGEWAMASAGGGVFWLRQAVTGIDEENGWIYFTTNRDASVERQLYRIRMDGTGMTRVSNEPGTHSIGMAPGARYYTDTYSNIRALPALSLHAADGTRREVLAPARPELLAPFGVLFPELTAIPAPDGFRMPARILRPASFQATRKYPVILFVYGGPSAPTVANAWQPAVLFDQLLLKEGYVVVQVDNRSATVISKRLENTILKRSPIPEITDLLAAVRWLKGQRWVDAARVGVWGWSGGGTMTVNLMTRSTEFKAGISVAPVTDWHYYDTFWTETLMKRPQDNPEGYAETSAVTRADRLHGRLLIAWGTYDDNVHPQNEQAFIDALIAAGKPFETMVYPMRKHGIDDAPATKHLYRAMLEFWKRSL